MRLYYNRTIDGYLRDPPRADLERLGMGRDREYQVNLDGETFNVWERRIALSAQTPGTMELLPSEFRGRIQAEDGTENSAIPYRIRRKSNSVNLDIIPKPVGFAGKHWLPLADVELNQEWQFPENGLLPGDSLVRTIHMRSLGLTRNHYLDSLFEFENRGIKVYPDSPERTQAITEQGVRVEMEQQQVIVLLREGPVRIPDIEMVYWDTVKGQEVRLQLPGQLLDISPLPVDALPPAQTGWNWTTILFGLPISIVVMVIIFEVYRRLRPGKQIGTGRRPEFSRRRLKRACLENRPKPAREELLNWAHTHWHDASLRSLSDIGQRSGSVGFHSAVRELETHLYGSDQNVWIGIRLWQAFIPLTKPIKTSVTNPTPQAWKLKTSN